MSGTTPPLSGHGSAIRANRVKVKFNVGQEVLTFRSDVKSRLGIVVRPSPLKLNSTLKKIFRLAHGGHDHRDGRTSSITRRTTPAAAVGDAGRGLLLSLLQRVGHDDTLYHRGHKCKDGLVVVFIFERSLYFRP